MSACSKRFSAGTRREYCFSAAFCRRALPANRPAISSSALACRRSILPSHLLNKKYRRTDAGIYLRRVELLLDVQSAQ